VLLVGVVVAFLILKSLFGRRRRQTVDPPPLRVPWTNRAGPQPSRGTSTFT